MGESLSRLVDRERLQELVNIELEENPPAVPADREP